MCVWLDDVTKQEVGVAEWVSLWVCIYNYVCVFNIIFNNSGGTSPESPLESSSVLYYL